jgi:hypothetical protein
MVGNKMNKKRDKQKGSVLPLVMVFMMVFFLMLAFVVDISWILNSRAQLQNAADAAALAAAAQLVDEDILYGSPNPIDDIIEARDYAEMYAFYNKAARRAITVDRNDLNEIEGGVVVGYISDPYDLDAPLEIDGMNGYNAVQVTTKFAHDLNGPLGLFLGAFTKVEDVEIGAKATAAIDDRVTGFALSEGETLDILPFTIYEQAWYAALGLPSTCPSETLQDNFAYIDGVVYKNQSDGIPEIKLYPNKEDVCGVPSLPGNFGTIDIGSSNNSTADLARQIRYGVTAEDIAIIGGLMLTDEDGDGIFSKWFNGDTGVSASIKDDLASIIGEPRFITLYLNAYGQGNGAYYEIVKFVGVRIMEVVLTGKMSQKHVTVQPTFITAQHAIINPNAPRSGYIYAIALVR